MYKYTLYALYCKQTGEIKYIGQTIHTLAIRLAKHRVSAKNPKQRVHIWMSQTEVEGFVLEEGTTDDPEYINRAEIQWIDLFLTTGFELLNDTKGGQQIRLFPGFKHSDESKEKMKGPRGETKGRGKVLSEEHKKKIGEASKKYWSDAEHRKQHQKKFSGENNPMYGKKFFAEENPFYGKQHTEKTRKKMIAAAKTRPPISEETREKLRFRNHNRWHVNRGIKKLDCTYCIK